MIAIPDESRRNSTTTSMCRLQSAIESGSCEDSPSDSAHPQQASFVKRHLRLRATRQDFAQGARAFQPAIRLDNGTKVLQCFLQLGEVRCRGRGRRCCCLCLFAFDEQFVDFGEDDLVRDGVCAEQGEDVVVEWFEAVGAVDE